MRATRAIQTISFPSSFFARIRARLVHIRGWHARFEAAVEAADPREIVKLCDLFFAAIGTVAFAGLAVQVVIGLGRYAACH